MSFLVRVHCDKVQIINDDVGSFKIIRVHIKFG